MMTNRLVLAILFLAASASQAAAQDGKVASSGKAEVALRDVPPAVLAAARAARPSFTPVEAEAETREGRRYFDVEGTLADGSEIEFDIMEEGGRWRVVETQRDIGFDVAPVAVRRAAAAHDAAFTPNRVIESSQADGLVIYELFGAESGDPRGRKIEIKWDGKTAEVLKQEWAH
ncbi:hypothetical protein [Sphingosinicella sp. BN140058]|uniref:hypothetical protein n=1 Tax=Sphingosinicella sp. BN140058 TaxID=1892855 RepID=UPI001013A026|nr:hypothetical protein [Sphingosinicella sp. BN140058]QAY76061.1 hypothetical protein ETR14_05605 [Sphingosinicella sp. BN140058]